MTKSIDQAAEETTREFHMRTKDRNNNPDVFSPWSYDAGFTAHAKLQDEKVRKLVEKTRKEEARKFVQILNAIEDDLEDGRYLFATRGYQPDEVLKFVRFIRMKYEALEELRKEKG